MEAANWKTQYGTLCSQMDRQPEGHRRKRLDAKGKGPCVVERHRLMMIYWKLFYCKHYSEKHGCRFFVFPKQSNERKKWLKLIRRQDREPSVHSLVCSCHFKDGDRKNGPTIFERNKAKRFNDELLTCKVRAKQSRKHTIDPPMLSESILGDSNTNCPVPMTSQETSLSFTEDTLLENASQKIETIPFQFGASLEAENYFLKKGLQEAQEKIKKLTTAFSFEHIKNSDSKILLHTGIPTKDIFMSLFDLFESIDLNYFHGWKVVNVPKVDQLLLTLMKLKLNLVNEDLALRFNICSKTVANIFFTWLYALHEVLFKTFMDKIPSRNKNRLCLPTCFNNFTNCRIILDCTEIYCMQPKNLENQKITYSSYKHRNTFKGLIGVAPNGVITFVSKLYPGSVSDKKIVKHSKILEQMEAGDLIIADKGFLIADLLPPSVYLNIPPFLVTPQLTPQQIVQTRTIAKARIHVEHAIKRIKCFKILNFIPANLVPHASYVFQVCSALTNFQFPLIRAVEDLYGNDE